MAVFNNSISQWVNGDIVDQTELNNLTQDLYQRLSAITDFTANRYNAQSLYPYKQGVILSVIGDIKVVGTNLVVGNKTLSTDNYAIAVRFPNNNSDLKQPGNGIFGFLPFGSNTITIPTTPNPFVGYAWLTYTITNSSGNNATNVVVPVLNIGTALPTGNAVVIATITAGIVDTTKTPNYLITQAADASDIIALSNKVALTPALFPAAPQVLFQQGRLTGSQGLPYGDTTSSPTLYFTPTEQGNLISLYNGISWVTQSLPTTDLQLSVTGLSGNYDIYVGNTSNGLALITNAWNNATPPVPTDRTQQDGRWVNNVQLGTIPPFQALLLGSINVSVTSGVANSGVVQSWYGYRGIWNLYNQIALGLLASQGILNIDGATRWGWGNNWYHNQNSIATTGASRFTFLIDPLYKTQLTCLYNGFMYIGSVSDGGATGIILNQSVPDSSNTLLPIVNASTGSVAQVAFTNTRIPFNTNYSYQFNNPIITASILPTGLNFIQKIEIGINVGYFSDGSGLTATYWG